jgi:hypothetical protein
MQTASCKVQPLYVPEDTPEQDKAEKNYILLFSSNSFSANTNTHYSIVFNQKARALP